MYSSWYPSSTRGSYRPLRLNDKSTAADKLTDAHLEKLRQFSREVKPIFRYSCPSGYTDSASAFDLGLDATSPEFKKLVAPNNVWFVDSHDKDAGHACMPKDGWGKQPGLGFNDELASMYRNKPKMDSASISSAASSLMCDPCARGRGCDRMTKCNISQAASALSDEVSHIKALDAEIDNKADDTGTLLSGGAKLSPETSCAIQDLVKPLSTEQRAKLKQTLETQLAEHQNKVTGRTKHQLDCIVKKYNESLATGETPLSAADLINHAVMCSEASSDPSLIDKVDGLSSICSPSKSCLSSMYQVKAFQDIQDKVKAGEYRKQQYAEMMKVYTKYHRAIRRCGVVTPEEELKIKCKLEGIVRKYYYKTKETKTMAQIEAEVNSMFDSFKNCAPKCGPTDGCGDGTQCVPSTNCSSKMCIPKPLDDIRKQAKAACEMAPAAEELSEYMKSFYSKQRHLRNL